MNTGLWIIIGMILIGFTSNAFAQYVGDTVSNDIVLGECIGGWGMCPEQHLAERLENDQKNALFVIIIGIPSLAVLGFIVLRKRK